jgi:DNA primase
VIPQAFIQELLARVDIADVVGRHVKLRKAGTNLLGLCPFHAEKSPSFTVSPTKQFYHCFGCGAHGSAIGFLMEHAGLSYVEAIGELASSVGLTVPREPGRGEPAERPDRLELAGRRDRPGGDEQRQLR